MSPRWLCGPFRDLMWLLVYLRGGHCGHLGGLFFLDLESLVFSFLFLNLLTALGNHIPSQRDLQIFSIQTGCH